MIYIDMIEHNKKKYKEKYGKEPPQNSLQSSMALTMKYVNKRKNWYKELKAKEAKKQKYFCPELNDFYMAVSTKKKCSLCHKEHHNIIYDKTIHDRLVFGEE